MTSTSKPLSNRQFFGMGFTNLESRFSSNLKQKNDAAYLVQGALAVMVRNALCPADFSGFSKELVRKLFMEDYDLSAVRELCVYFKEYFNEEEWAEVTARLFPNQQEFAQLEERTRVHIEKIYHLLHSGERPVEVKASLVTTFEDENGKKHGWTLSNVDPNLTTEEHDALLAILTTLDIFQKDGVRRFAKLVGAYYNLVQVTINPQAVKEEAPELKAAKFAVLPKVASLSIDADADIPAETIDSQEEPALDEKGEFLDTVIVEEEAPAPKLPDELPKPNGLAQGLFSGMPLVESLKLQLKGMVNQQPAPVVPDDKSEDKGVTRNLNKDSKDLMNKPNKRQKGNGGKKRRGKKGKKR
ncbi:hypothetical protein JZO70_18510 [Enterococcus sp. 669A]|uniref:DUF5343 domain-containing protein n=1 Tax=Candidatus Enterococcus moelleringii TaxID=2815325 RepID=A0ABS3LGH2_9ENTE|nr:hypothetical protein [Enterococcus sp. 669A]MBO1308175.1 hypothetical protein [Enterococcus sp. 669A]